MKSTVPAEWAEVALSIYELPGSSALNSLTRAANLGGAYHVGVEAYWLEWSFGWCEEGSGVYMVHPGQSSLGTFCERVPLGRTALSPKEMFVVLTRLRAEFQGSDYDLLRKNCAHFSVAFVKQLCVSDAPLWVNSLADVGKHLVAQLGLEDAQAAADAATPPKEYRAAPPFANFDEQDVSDLTRDGDDVALRELAWRRSQTFVLEKAVQAERAAEFVDLEVELRWRVPEEMDLQAASALLATLMDLLSVRQVLAEAFASGFGLHSHYLSQVAQSEPANKRDVQVRRLRLLSVRTVSAQLRLRGNALDNSVPSAWQDSNFREVLRNVGRNARGLAGRWPQGGAELVASFEILTAPGQAASGSRVELSTGSYKDRVIHAKPLNEALDTRSQVSRQHQQASRSQAPSQPRHASRTELRPDSRPQQDLRAWYATQQQLWQFQQRLPLSQLQAQQLQHCRPQVEQKQQQLEPFRSKAAYPATSNVQDVDPPTATAAGGRDSLAKLQRIQQMGCRRRAMSQLPERETVWV
eukprot:TRINITY_DN11317_c0_g1_i1.p1 TRINITY_DN11317_c0_g1~~TRINITY_DN11317_c0_g1_i1.p1  ORF type:complete len:543 (+),score=123.33 TRINITY_DN11317_c0_g1_i1:59-1630(+)